MTELTEQESNLELWHNGQDLAHMTASPGWDVILATLKEMEENSTDALISENPADKDRVLAAHAVAFAVSQMRKELLGAVDRSIEFHRTRRLADLMQPEQQSLDLY